MMITLKIQNTKQKIFFFFFWLSFVANVSCKNCHYSIDALKLFEFIKVLESSKYSWCMNLKQWFLICCDLFILLIKTCFNHFILRPSKSKLFGKFVCPKIPYPESILSSTNILKSKFYDTTKRNQIIM